MLHTGPLKLMFLTNYNSHQSACFPLSFIILLNYVTLTLISLNLVTVKGKKQTFLPHYICATRNIKLGLVIRPT